MTKKKLKSSLPLDVSAAPAELYIMPGHMFRRVYQVSQAIFDIEVAKAGRQLTPGQFAVLTMVAARPGVDQATLAGLIAFDRATTGGIVDRLAGKGLIRREIDSTDRRARKLFLEPSGVAMLKDVTPIVRASQDLMTEGLSAQERTMLLKLMAKILTTLGDVSRPSQANTRSTTAEKALP
jgi:MarR family transcriptional regulator, temperature-dependent positive regulator of motility